MDRLIAFAKRQPIATIGTSITAFVVAGIGVLNAFQPGAVTDDQIASIVKALGAMWLLLALIWPTVTPSAAPKLREGADVTLHDGTSGVVTRK